ncbi:MAG: PDZ domain-containing protein [Saprospiraceae bacterium]|nr:PDZ domain-containing protein [Saprospiraceae bacterium]
MNIKTILSFVTVFTLMTGTYAQESKPTKKVVVIKKTDDNGKVTEIRKEAEGAEAEELIKELEKEGVNISEKSADGKKVIRIEKSVRDEKIISSDNKNGEKEIEIMTEVKDGKTREKYKIIKKTDDGKEKVLEWDGEGKMPEEIEKEIGHININRNFDGENMEIRVDTEIDEGGNEEKIIIKEGEDGRERMVRIREDENGFFPDKAPRRLNFKTDKPNTNKASLGVMIEDTDHGVVITDIVEGSSAANARLRREDVLLKVNDQYIFTTNGLIDALRPYNPGEKIKVRVIRDGKEKSFSAVLKSRD